MATTFYAIKNSSNQFLGYDEQYQEYYVSGSNVISYNFLELAQEILDDLKNYKNSLYGCLDDNFEIVKINFERV